jgi:putative PIN family toxin of toxin-antitoxin system
LTELTSELKRVVLDTNIVLDMFVFNDPATLTLKSAIKTSKAAGPLQWIATPVMRDELERVLTYPHIALKLVFYKISAEFVLAQFDQSARMEPVAAKAPVACKDPDDQKFIDLAVAHQALLLSKDNAVLCMKKRLLGLGVVAQTAII